MPPIKPKLVNRGTAGLLSKQPAKPANGESHKPGEPAPRPKTFNKIAPALKPHIVPIDSLTPDPNNARLHPDRNLESIMDSLAFYGQVKPVVVRDQTGVVMAGNGTMAAAKAMGWTKLAAIRVPMTDAEAAGYGLADNRTAELARWDFEVVARLDRIISEAGGQNVGWSIEELTALRMDLVPRHVSPDKIPDTPSIPVSRIGDLWSLGDHRLMCGDATDARLCKKLFGGKRFLLLATDPPYGVDFVGQKYNPRAKAWAGIKGDRVQGEKLESFIETFLAAWIPNADRRSAFYFWTAAMQEGYAALQGIKNAGLHVQSQVIWVKNTLVLGQADYHWKHENCWYAFWKGEKHNWYGGRDKTSVWEVDKVANASYLHPMQKPTKLYETPMEHHTRPGEIVAEPFAGSGTQFIAAQTLGRVCYGMELDPVYCDVTLQRWADFTGLDPLRSDGASFMGLKKKQPTQ